MKPSARIRVRLLGRLELTREGEAAGAIKLSTRKAGALVAYLAMRSDQTASREELATLLWGDCSESQARQSLRQALASLRKELQGSEFFISDNETVRLQPDLWLIDAREFEELTKSANAADLDRAAALFGGEFLSGHNNIGEEAFDEWLRAQRQRAQLSASRLCETYAARPGLVRDGERAIAVVERLLALDPLREDCQRVALTLYARYRGRTEALAQAEAFAGVLERELGVAPEKETRALIERIRTGAIAPVEVAAANPVEVGRTKGEVAGSAAAAHAATPGASAGDVAVVPLAPPTHGRPPRAMAAGLVLLGLALAGGLWGLSSLRSTASRTVAPLAAAKSETPPFAHLWQSPPLLSRPDGPAFREMTKDLIPILVLPFKTFGESAGSTELLSDMITDDLTNLLSRVSLCA
jgi:DNA-binding SARP family transcriptional activator